MHEVFTAARPDISMVEEFVALRLPEGLTIEYKGGDGGKVLVAAAAMANTYGGLILVGVDADEQDRRLPGRVVGVSRLEKARLVGQMGSRYDPPWCPEVHEVPMRDGERFVLVIRIDPATAPRPVIFEGRVMVRLDEQNAAANQRLIRVLLDENPVVFEDGSDEPSRGAGSLRRSPFHLDQDPPDVVARVITSMPLWAGHRRLRLGPTAAEEIRAALDEARTLDQLRRIAGVIQEVPPQLVASDVAVRPWRMDPRRATSRYRAVRAGTVTGDGSVVRPGVRMECVVELVGAGQNRSVEARVDTLFWLPADRRKDAGRLGMDVVAAAFHAAVPALAAHVLPATVRLAIGQPVYQQVPPIELHLEGNDAAKDGSGGFGRIHLDDVVGFGLLGDRTGEGSIVRGSAWLLDELLASGRWDEAVDDALTLMAEDWGYLSPAIPNLSD